MTIKLRKDKLAVSIYARHGDTCTLAPHCKSLRCASGFDSSDYVLSAQFAYLQEAIDYAQDISKSGVRVRLISRIVPNAPHVSDYPKPMAIEHAIAEQEQANANQHGVQS